MNIKHTHSKNYKKLFNIQENKGTYNIKFKICNFLTLN